MIRGAQIDTSTLKNDCSMVSTFVEALHAYHRAVFWETEKLGVHNQGRLMSGWSVMDANLVDEIRRIRLDTWRHFESMASDISVANLAQGHFFNPSIVFFKFFGDGNYFSSWWTDSGRLCIVVFCGLATRIRLLRVSAETKLGRNWLASLRGLIVAFRTKEKYT